MYADSNLVSLRYSTETVWGETPATPTMQDLRFTGETLSHNKQMVQSNEIRSDRMVPSIIQVGVDAGGKVDVELSSGTYDDLIASTLGSTWTTINLTAMTLSFTAATHKVVRTAGSWAVDGIVLGVFVKFGGTAINAGNKGPYKVTAITTTTNPNDTLTLEDPDNGIVDQAGVAAGTANARWIRNGVLKISHLFEVGFTDIGKFLTFNGCRIAQLDLNYAARQILTGSLSVMGKIGAAANATVSGSITPKTTSASVSASSDVGLLRSQGVDLTAGITQAGIQYSNSLRTRPVVGQGFTADLGYGRIDLKINLTALFPDLTLFNQVIAHSAINLTLPVTDVNGKYIFCTVPAFRVSGSPDASGGNKDVTLAVQGLAERDPVTNCMIQIDTIV